MRSNCQSETERKRKILKAICITDRSRRKAFTELSKVSRAVGYRIPYNAANVHLHMRLGPSGKMGQRSQNSESECAAKPPGI